MNLKLSATLFASIVLLSCSNEKKNAQVNAPAGMHALDLKRYGKPFVIFVPDTTAAKLTVSEQPSGALDIIVGRNFAVSINEQAADLELRKTDIRNDEVNKLKNMVKEEPGGIIWESAITEPEYHFILNKKVGNSEYSFEDVKDGEHGGFRKEAVEKMYESCNSISGTAAEG
jgi:hypothetical protein